MNHTIKNPLCYSILVNTQIITKTYENNHICKKLGNLHFLWKPIYCSIYVFGFFKNPNFWRFSTNTEKGGITKEK